MKKVIVSLFLLSNLSFAITIGSVSLVPEIGGSYKNESIGAYNYNTYGFSARVWLGYNNIFLAPQYKYYKADNVFYSFDKQQYGLSLGYNLDLSIISILPYVGFNYSKFNALFENDISYNVGVRLKTSILPIFASVEYEYEKLNYINGGKTNASGFLFNVGVSF